MATVRVSYDFGLTISSPQIHSPFYHCSIINLNVYLFYRLPANEWKRQKNRKISSLEMRTNLFEKVIWTQLMSSFALNCMPLITAISRGIEFIESICSNFSFTLWYPGVNFSFRLWPNVSFISHSYILLHVSAFSLFFSSFPSPVIAALCGTTEIVCMNCGSGEWKLLVIKYHFIAKIVCHMQNLQFYALDRRASSNRKTHFVRKNQMRIMVTESKK